MANKDKPLIDLTDLGNVTEAAPSGSPTNPTDCHRYHFDTGFVMFVPDRMVDQILLSIDIDDGCVKLPPVG